MPRKTKDSKNKIDTEKKEVAKRSKKSTTTTKKESSKEKNEKKVASLSEVVKKAVKSVSAKPKKVVKANKKVDDSTKTAKKSTKKSTTSKPKKAVKAKAVTKAPKKTTKKSVTAKTKKVVETDKKAEVSKKPAKKATTTKSKKTVKADKNVKTTVKAIKESAVAKAKKVTDADKKAKATKKAVKKAVKKSTSPKPKKASTSSKSSRKTAVKRTTSRKKSSSKAVIKQPEIIEYYDLPYRYNQTVVKILAQTPTTLFVYWDISDEDRNNYLKKFGNSFFDNTYPVLIVHNKTMNYSFEIEINDFANSWYFNVNDAKCDYEIELGRRAKSNQSDVQLPYNYQYVTSSNVIEAPNNHILFEKNQSILFFRNVKTNALIRKEISSFEFMKYIGKIYNAYNVYKQMYKNEELQDLKNNPSSGFKLL